jgi:hypothetical protein
MKTHFHDNNPTKVWFDTGPIIFHIWSHVKLEKKGGGEIEFNKNSCFIDIQHHIVRIIISEEKIITFLYLQSGESIFLDNQN